MRRLLHLFALVLILVLPACNESSDSDGEPLTAEAGFMEIEPVTFSVQQDGVSMTVTSSPARLWYVFQPADENPKDKPTAIIFNGGPGSSSMYLFTSNTARLTTDVNQTGTESIVANPNAWTRFANLLYVDARDCGFSYIADENAALPEARKALFDVQNFNAFLDAADFDRVLLRFLTDHPALADNGVIVIGESYGGLRSTLMLNLLLYHERYEQGTEPYQDTALFTELYAFLVRFMPENAPWRPEDVARFFGRQVLIQPYTFGDAQELVAGEMFETPGSIIYQVAEDTGTEYVTCGDDPDCNSWDNAVTFVQDVAERCPYYVIEGTTWLDDYWDKSVGPLTSTAGLAKATAFPVPLVWQMYAENRTEAVRRIGADSAMDTSKLPAAARTRLRLQTAQAKRQALPAGDLAETFGTLQPWDAYLLLGNQDVNFAFWVNTASEAGIDEILPYHSRMGELFLDNLRVTETFITNAAYDLICFTAAFPETIADYEDIESATLKTEGTEARPGVIEVLYAGEGEESARLRTIRFPTYLSSHSVPVNKPEEITADIEEWLQESK